MKLSGVFVIAALTVSALADTYVWQGGNQNFNNGDNWEGPVPQEGNGVSETDMRALRDVDGEELSTSFTSFISGGDYNVGSRLRLPRNGKLIFEANAPVSIKFSENVTGPATTFKGVRRENSFLFNCKKNWGLQRSSGIIPASSPPCQDDDVIFPSGGSYSPFSEERISNVNSLMLGDKMYEDCEDLPGYQFTGMSCSRFFINDASYCVDALTTYDENGDATGDCMCFNACPTEEELNAEKEAIRRAAEIAAAKEQALLDLSVSRNVELTIDFAIFGDDQGIMESAFDSSDFMAMFSSEIASFANNEVLLQQVSTLYNPDLEQATVTGLAAAVVADFLGATDDVKNFDTENANAADADTVVYETDAFVDAERSVVATFMSQKFVETAYKVLDSFAHEGVDGLLAEQCFNGTSDFSELAQSLMAFSKDLIQDDIHLMEIISGVCDLNGCMNETEIFMALNSSFDDSVIMMAQDVLADVSFENQTCLLDVLTSEEFGDAIEFFGDASDTSAPGLETFQLTSDWIYAGNDLPEVDVFHAVNQDNLPGFTDALELALRARTFIRSVINLQVNTPSRLLRRDVADDQFAFKIAYEYEADATTAANFQIVFGSVAYEVVRDVVDDVLATFEAQVPACYDLVSNTFDAACIEDKANEFVDTLPTDLTDEEAQQRIADFIQSLVECGAFGRDANGDCYSNSPPSDVDTETIINTAASGYDNDNASSSSMTLIYAGAGAGVGVIIIVIIIIVVVKKRGPSDVSSSAAKDGGRTVVAFENPMYDNPEADTVAAGDQPLYEDAGADEGLYDEPAFNDTAKMNPVYQSTEDLTAGFEEGGEDEGGYLDVAPDEDE